MIEENIYELSRGFADQGRSLNKMQECKLKCTDHYMSRLGKMDCFPYENIVEQQVIFLMSKRCHSQSGDCPIFYTAGYESATG